MSDAFALASAISRRLIEVDGAVAVVLGGSHATGTATAYSDIDLGIYYDPGRPLAVSELRAVAHEIAGSSAASAVTEIGGWGPWINGGAWLTVDGTRVDWIYRDVRKVRHWINSCRDGVVEFHSQAGHPFAFGTHIYAGEVALCEPLDDPEGIVRELKSLTSPYPPALKRALLRTVSEARFSLRIAEKGALRGDAVYVSGCLFRCAAVLAQVLFALNERYWLNEKGAIALAGTLPVRPDAFDGVMQAALSAPGATPDALGATVRRVAEVVSLVEELVTSAI